MTQIRLFWVSLFFFWQEKDILILLLQPEIITTIYLCVVQVIDICIKKIFQSARRSIAMDRLQTKRMKWDCILANSMCSSTSISISFPSHVHFQGTQRTAFSSPDKPFLGQRIKFVCLDNLCNAFKKKKKVVLARDLMKQHLPLMNWRKEAKAREQSRGNSLMKCKR